MLGYAIFNIKVTNPEDYKEYLQQVRYRLIPGIFSPETNLC